MVPEVIGEADNRCKVALGKQWVVGCGAAVGKAVRNQCGVCALMSGVCAASSGGLLLTAVCHFVLAVVCAVT